MMEFRKSSFDSNHSNDCFNQEQAMDVKISGWKDILPQRYILI